MAPDSQPGHTNAVCIKLPKLESLHMESYNLQTNDIPQSTAAPSCTAGF